MIKRILKKLLRKEGSGQESVAGEKNIQVGDYQLIAPGDHQLDVYLNHFPEYSQNFPRVAGQILKGKPEQSIIDIGANIGDTIALLRKYQVNNHVYCVEGDEIYYEFLSTNSEQFSDVTLLKYYLSDTEESKGYYVETKDGTAKIIETQNSSIRSELKTLDNVSTFIDFSTVRIIKIDTDGFDCKILRGALKLIKGNRPVLFFEYHYDLSKEQDEYPLQILTTLKEQGYSGIIYYDNFGKLICATQLNDNTQLVILDNYIQNGKGSFPYYDVFVFHQDDESLMQEILLKEIGSQDLVND